MTITRKKDLSIETLRGMAIILVVMGHVIGYDSTGGMKVADDSFLRHFYFTFQYIRMPLFTAISGWVYALAAVKAGSFNTFEIKKARRILLPLLFVGGSYYILQSIVPNTNTPNPLNEIWTLLVFPYTFYWYLYALFIVFTVVAFIDIYKLCDTVSHWLGLVAIGFIVLYIRDSVIPDYVRNVWAFKNAIYLFPYFMLGLGVKRFPEVFKTKYLLTVVSMLLVAGLLLQQLAWYKIIECNLKPEGILGLSVGILGVITLLNMKFQNKQFIWIGNFAYTIYLFHSFGTSGGRILLKAGGIHNSVAIFFISLLCGLAFPILVEKVLDKNGITRMLFLGRPMNKKGE